ncbi:potassium voltage-gated channel subfamily A member 10-like [Bolinopsis microptera]|uniref:potassium voltage-gated channel subfamily A member 10-like n=1 Tax=Bolinopsis microptera TaxID=2820187 RepID=UPI00307970C2
MAFTAGLNKSATPGRSTFVLNTVKVSRDHLDENKIRVRDFTRFNVSGRVFLIRTENLNMFPDTLLGSSDKNRFWRDDLNAYYFDRNREFFVSVQQFYQLKDTNPTSNPDTIPTNRQLSANSSDGFSLKAIKSVDPSQREKLYNLLNFANSSSSANVLAWVDCLLIGLSVIMLIIESEPTYKKYFAENGQEAHKFAFAANSVIMGYFTFDYVLRIIAHPSTLGIFRVTRVFKLVRRCEALLVLVRALSRTTKELLLLAAMVSLSALLLGSVMYYVEYSHEVAEACSRQGREMSMRCKFNSIPNSCWWAVITITTVGYGDMVPETFPGKIVGTIAVFLALVLIALPATIIVTKFSEEYEKGVSQVEQDDVMG